MFLRFALPFAALTALTIAPATAQRRQPTPEQRIERLEKQVRQVQGRVFPKGQPADTAGFSDDPAVTQSTAGQLVSRLDSVERQMAELVRSSEENGNRLGVMEAEIARLRADNDRRLRSLESGAPAGDAADQGAAEILDAPPPAPQPKVETAGAAVPPSLSATAPSEDAGEAAYDKGYKLWNAKRYDQAITALKKMASAYPGHRRVSWAHNLAGRAMLDKGEPRAAAEALLANYRRDPKGERAADSLFYLGQSLVALGQTGQACKAYAELEDVYGATMRGDLQRLLPPAKAAAKCR